MPILLFLGAGRRFVRSREVLSTIAKRETCKSQNGICIVPRKSDHIGEKHVVANDFTEEYALRFFV